MITPKQSLRIKKKLLEENKTVKALAEEFGIARTYLSGIISGKRNNSVIETRLKETYLKTK